MNGQSPSSKSPWYTEPLRRISNYLAAAVAVLGAGIAVANELTGFGFVPDNIRTDITVGIGVATGVVAFLHKVQGYLSRNGVPGTTFNGMLSPEHTHQAMVASAQPAPLPVTTVTDRAAVVGAALGMNPDGTPISDGA